jgi:tRNA threonylcarbamoyladenosine biosynthesis protein TsaB
MDYLLHIDTSADTCTVALAGDGILLAYKESAEARNHAGNINNMIGELLADAGISFPQLSAIAVCAGPGSYTGLRIGMATAKGLCYAVDTLLLLDNKLALLAYQAYTQNKNYNAYISLLNARDKEYFITIYNNEFKCILEPQHVLEPQLEQILAQKNNSYIITDSPEFVADPSINLYVDRVIKINLTSWGMFSFEKFKCNETVKLYAAEPFYLKQVYTHK